MLRPSLKFKLQLRNCHCLLDLPPFQFFCLNGSIHGKLKVSFMKTALKMRACVCVHR